MGMAVPWKRVSYTSVIYLLFLALFLSTYSSPAQGYDINRVYSKYTYFILFFVFIITLLSLHFKKKQAVSVTVGMILFILLGGILIFSSINRPSSLRWILTPVGWTLLWFLIIITGINAADVGPKNYTSIFRWFTIRYAFASLVIALIAAFITHISIGPITIIQYANYPRLAGWYVNPNGLAPVLVTGVLCTISAGINELNKWSKASYYSLAILFAFGVLLTGSRGPTGTLIITLFVYITIKFKYKYKKLEHYHYMIGACILFIGALIGLFLLARVDLFQRGSPFSRFEIWKNTPSIIRTSSALELLFGHGHLYFIDTVGLSSHSDYIRFLVNYGLLSIIILASIGAVTIRYISQYLKYGYTKREFDIALFSSLLVYISMYMIYGQATFQVRFSSFMLVAAIAPVFAYANPTIKLQHF
ncbi:O-antigen ligase family protein [Halorubrum ezzemoulense]|uniref:O-antigen ligase family protein n=1 Tax=Halorubrum ezzemoulense TaxID=337243 RepID=UPI0011818616|nr:hypothetical protein [Halorubrum ezzemoulense]